MNFWKILLENVPLTRQSPNNVRRAGREEEIHVKMILARITFNLKHAVRLLKCGRLRTRVRRDERRIQQVQKDGEVPDAVVAGDFNDGGVRMEATSRGSHDGDGPLHASPRETLFFFCQPQSGTGVIDRKKKILTKYKKNYNNNTHVLVPENLLQIRRSLGRAPRRSHATTCHQWTHQCQKEKWQCQKEKWQCQKEKWQCQKEKWPHKFHLN